MSCKIINLRQVVAQKMLFNFKKSILKLSIIDLNLGKTMYFWVENISEETYIHDKSVYLVQKYIL